MEQLPRRKLDFIFDRNIRPDLSPIVDACRYLFETTQQGVGGLEQIWFFTQTVFPEGFTEDPEFQVIIYTVANELMTLGSSTTLDRCYHFVTSS